MRSSPQDSSGERFRLGTSHPGETRGLRGAKPGPNPLKVRMMIEVLYILAGEVFLANFGDFIFDW